MNMSMDFVGVPPEFKNAKLSDFDVAVTSRFALLGMREDQMPWLFISGPTGVGKTHLAAAICNRIFREDGVFFPHYWPYFINPQQMIDRINSTYHNDSSETKEKVMDKYYGYGVIRYTGTTDLPIPMVIDDIGIENKSSPDIENIVSVRGNYRAVTIFTSNLSLDDLAKKYSDRIASRIRGLAIPIVMTGKDRRGTR